MAASPSTWRLASGPLATIATSLTILLGFRASRMLDGVAEQLRGLGHPHRVPTDDAYEVRGRHRGGC
ncbi:MAG: hypothetical protein QOG20_5501 [Pseudonocardiales bacterium]|jgi:hypothetical protein|nr:hypothetical protein [Pseudonocardiales bacterium]